MGGPDHGTGQVGRLRTSGVSTFSTTRSRAADYHPRKGRTAEFSERSERGIFLVFFFFFIYQQVTANPMAAINS